MSHVPPHSDSDEDLLARYVGGDEGAFARLVRETTPELFRFLVRFVGQRALAEDILQETYVQVHLSAATFDRSRRVKPWIFTIAANKARDALRSRTRRREVSAAGMSADGEFSLDLTEMSPGETPQPGDGISESENSEAVRRVVMALPDHLREVIVLAYFHRMAYRDMADVLSVPIGTIKSRLHAAVSQFARAFRQAEDLPAVEGPIAARVGEHQRP